MSRHDVHGPATPVAMLARVAATLLLAVSALLTAAVGGVAAAGADSASSQAQDRPLPAELTKYVPDSAEWKRAAWMVIPTCAGRGGDFSLWVISVLRDTPALLEHYQPSASAAAARNKAILDGYRALGENALDTVPAGYCVDDVRRWAGADETMKPFGFAWGTTGQSSFYCTDRDPDSTREQEYNRHVGAERGPCDGFAISCDGAKTTGAKTACAQWNAFAENHVRRVEQVRRDAIAAHPAVARAAVTTSGSWLPMIGIGAAGLAALLLVPLVHRRVSRGRR
ncbi:hypothetical protein ALI22I_20140 [Saccharothrix sp. ALI-22-I]|uniref:hypothetical protein n=1 Tax=Saccharothrix sp. ALI-22-I TaxID=1933778 RepID=UPI0009C88758|nr:hypothetical protein [Saccharothrix sp. ALI-22-I]ONI88053.1 hypothetical protein ALI22I_20140 [Saccharothrix sp. ALI-22-I]